MQNLIWKDFKVSFRSTGGLLFLFAIIGCVPSLFFSYEALEKISDVIYLKYYMLNYITFFPAMQIPMLGTLVIQVNLNEDRRNYIFRILLANGTKQEKIWMSEMLVSIIWSYVLSIWSVIEGILFTKIMYKIWIPINSNFILYVFIIIPIICIGFLAIIATIMWVSKKGQFLAGFIPVISYMLCMYMNTYIAEKKLSMNSITIFWIVMDISCICFICYNIIKRLEKEYLINVEA